VFPDPRPTTAVDAAATPILSAATGLICASLALTLLSAFGVAETQPATIRAALVVLTAVTLPGLPIAALMRLPFNGVFASVTIGISMACALLAPQLCAVAGIWNPWATQLLVLGLSTVMTGLLARQWYRQPTTSSTKPAVGPAECLRRVAGGTSVLSIATLLVSGILLIHSVGKIDTDHTGAYGVVAVLSTGYFVGIGLLCTVMAVEYRRAVLDRKVIACANVLLIMYVSMTVAWADGTAPFPTAYIHRYLANWIADSGQLPPPVDARVSWSGFFSAAAHLMSVGSLTDSEAFLMNASLFFGVLLIFPVLAIALAITGSRRTAWLAVTIYVVFNWYQQDYFAPQATAMQLFATILAVLLWQWRSLHGSAGGGARLPSASNPLIRLPARVPGTDARWNLAMESILVLIIASMVVSHQLTPLVAIAAMAVVAALGMTRYKLLWLVGLLIFTAWFTYGARDYWIGHLPELLSELGSVASSIDSGVSARVSGDPVYGRMQGLRMASLVLLMCLSAAGWLRLLRSRSRFVWVTALLASAPFGLVAVQSYGGEVVIRCFLYASLILAPLSALALQRLFRGGFRVGDSRLIVAAGAAALTALAVLGVTNRGLNTAFEHTTKPELRIASELLAQVDRSRIAYWGQGVLLQLPKVSDLGLDCISAQRDLADCTAEEDADYLIVTVQDFNFLRYRYGVAPEVVDASIEKLIATRTFEMVYRDGIVKILKRPSATPVTIGNGS
jgi:hypothetical protein